MKFSVQSSSEMVRTTPGQKIPIDKLQTTLGELEKLQEKAKEELSLRESIKFLREQLKSALKKGYSYQDLSQLLEKQEIKVSAATLKQYLTEIAKEKRSRQRRAKPKEVLYAEDLTQTSTESSVIPAVVGVTEDSQNAPKNLGQSAEESKKKQSLSDGGKDSQKTAKATRRQTPKTSKPSSDILSEFNQY
ncbi:hypothetical protein [Nostoc sphaeroides]|uniref:Mobilization protein MobC n=1 Tax=Nostoc sphaeroides CCNUC1 TaxID=2653204 RepID=A0A5P8WE08_9NOSO|nr:hypothetical protein [Nostoc sphaeroides]MCC5632390.1 hypothetical protein [Nostoc sphaeroides CHAB 2801]QFS50396.1 hypothetical protein GXM_07890 [Nostoc sphaeroides CCNUC1]